MPHHGRLARGGESEINDFEPGDIWYFPRGHGHMLECLGNKPTHFILIFDNGYFSEFGTFSITDWLGHTPKALLAKNLGVSESTFNGFPKEEVYFVRGPHPPAAQPTATGKVRLKSPSETHKYRMLAQDGRIAVYKAARAARGGVHLFPISKTVYRRHLDLDPGRIARVALASLRATSGNTSSKDK